MNRAHPWVNIPAEAVRPFVRLASSPTGFAPMRIWGSIRRTLDSLTRGDAVPPELTEQAVIPGIPGARFRADRDLGAFVQVVLDDNRRELEAMAQAGMTGDPLPPAHLLAISGGGDAGAY